jgi:hypothetical protein
VPAVGQAVAHVPTHADTVPPLVLIAVAWKEPDAQGEQTMLAVADPAVA